MNIVVPEIGGCRAAGFLLFLDNQERHAANVVEQSSDVGFFRLAIIESSRDSLAVRGGQRVVPPQFPYARLGKLPACDLRELVAQNERAQAFWAEQNHRFGNCMNRLPVACERRSGQTQNTNVQRGIISNDATCVAHIDGGTPQKSIQFEDVIWKT